MCARLRRLQKASNWDSDSSALLPALGIDWLFLPVIAHLLELHGRETAVRYGRGKDAARKSPTADFSTPLGNPAHGAGFPLCPPPRRLRMGSNHNCQSQTPRIHGIVSANTSFCCR